MCSSLRRTDPPSTLQPQFVTIFREKTQEFTSRLGRMLNVLLEVDQHEQLMYHNGGASLDFLATVCRRPAHRLQCLRDCRIRVLLDNVFDQLQACLSINSLLSTARTSALKGESVQPLDR